MNKGNIIQMVELTQDITERKRAEEAFWKARNDIAVYLRILRIPSGKKISRILKSTLIIYMPQESKTLENILATTRKMLSTVRGW